ncbi:MAG: hypothetical protein PHP08_03275 [Candidatus Dojkabacteria bacterium]|nr:hypothetical protein [Candidatus Dojkabacteria bacterium]
MKKQNIWLIIKNEIFYWLLIVVLTGFFLYITALDLPKKILLSIGILDIILLETWFIKTFFMFSGRKISQYSEVIQRISLKDRFFDYFIIPAIFLGTFLLFLYFNKNIIMSYWVLTLSMLTLLILFINVKSSLGKFYKLSSLTKGIFNLVCIITFYLSINIVLRLDVSTVSQLISVGVLSLFILLSDLQLHDRLNFESIFISILSSLFISLSIAMFILDSIFVSTAIGTVAIYIIIALWNIRFSGKYKFIDYLPPLLYGLISLILIFNL